MGQSNSSPENTAPSIDLGGVLDKAYQILRVPADVDEDTLNEVYGILMSIKQPSRLGDEYHERALREFGQIQKAYALLSDPVTRQTYDGYIHAHLEALEEHLVLAQKDLEKRDRAVAAARDDFIQNTRRFKAHQLRFSHPRRPLGLHERAAVMAHYKRSEFAGCSASQMRRCLVGKNDPALHAEAEMCYARQYLERCHAVRRQAAKHVVEVQAKIAMTKREVNPRYQPADLGADLGGAPGPSLDELGAELEKVMAGLEKMGLDDEQHDRHDTDTPMGGGEQGRPSM